MALVVLRVLNEIPFSGVIAKFIGFGLVCCLYKPLSCLRRESALDLRCDVFATAHVADFRFAFNVDIDALYER
jgi:hypothetical protein